MFAVLVNLYKQFTTSSCLMMLAPLVAPMSGDRLLCHANRICGQKTGFLFLFGCAMFDVCGSCADAARLQRMERHCSHGAVPHQVAAAAAAPALLCVCRRLHIGTHHGAAATHVSISLEISLCAPYICADTFRGGHPGA